MQCPLCAVTGTDAKTKVQSTVALDGEVERRRRCENGHHLVTHERPATFTLAHVQVSREGTVVEFDRGKLHKDLEMGVLGLLEPEVITHVVDQVCGDVLTHLRKELLFNSGSRAVTISDFTIMELMERRLREGTKNRVAHLMYAMTIRGRTDVRSSKREKFLTATDLYNWMIDPDKGNYADLAVSRVYPLPSSPAEVWWLHRGKPRDNVKVIKPRRLESGSGHTPFRFDQFANSIRKALQGRRLTGHRVPHSKDKQPNDTISELLAAWVMEELEGQPIITSSQLADGAMRGLRRIDDIGYLRYATVVKKYDQAAQIRDEVIGLMEAPSRPLRFRAPATRLYGASSGLPPRGWVMINDPDDVVALLGNDATTHRQADGAGWFDRITGQIEGNDVEMVVYEDDRLDDGRSVAHIHAADPNAAAQLAERIGQPLGRWPWTPPEPEPPS